MGVAGMPFIKATISTSSELPTLLEAACSFPVFVLGAEIWFYYGHRLLHHKALYPHCHKVHHEYKAPFAIVALYSHPLEALQNSGVVNFGPVMMGCLTPQGSHVLLYYVWGFVATFGILIHHCGYELPLDGVPFLLRSMSDFHDYHHQYYDVNFGVLGILDWLHGTSSGYQGWMWSPPRSESLKSK